MKKIIFPVVSLAMMTGCMVGPNYTKRPVAEILNNPDSSATSPVTTTAAAKTIDDWWKRFNDPVLNDLIEQAYRNNHSFKSAELALKIARAQYDYAVGALFPTLDAVGSLTKIRSSHRGISGNRNYKDYKVGFDASWEADVFGGIRRGMNAAEASMQAQTADLETIWISLSGELAQYYISLRTLQARLIVAQENLEAQKDTYDLLKSQYDGGIGDALGMYQAEYSMENTRSQIPVLESSIVEVENAIAVLIGIAPGTLPATVRQLAKIPEADAIDLEAGIPAEALQQRPDVIAAERALAAATEQIGVAEASRYPRFVMTGSIGLDSISSGKLFDRSSFYNFGPAVSLPIFRGGQIKANIVIATAQQEQALAAYEEIVLSALGEVKSALVGYQKQKERFATLRRAVTAARNAYNTALDKYRNGLVDFNNVLDAQRSLLSYAETEAICAGEIATSNIKLYKALAGGWATENIKSEKADTKLFNKNAASLPKDECKSVAGLTIYEEKSI